MNTLFTPDKPFKTYQEMVAYLQDFHHLACLDPAWDASVLQLVPYYDLINGYKELFMSGDKFKPGISFEYLYFFHAFDHSLQNILFEFIVIIENYFKNNLAHVISRDFGVDVGDYLSYKNYRSSRGGVRFDDIFSKIAAIYQKTPSHSIDEPTRHYVLHHNHVPPWILMKNVTFSNSINLFSLMKSPQKEAVSDLLVSASIPAHEKTQLIYYILTLIRKFRNVIAHNLKFISFDVKKYSRAINMKSLKRFAPNELLTWRDLHRQIGVYDVYGYIVLSLSFLPNSLEKMSLVQNLISFLDNYVSENQLHKSIFQNYCGFTGIPQDIILRLKSYVVSITPKVPLPSVRIV